MSGVLTTGYRRIVAREYGEPDVLEIEHVDRLPEPGPGEARVCVEAAGVGYTDTILRRGRYALYKGGLPLTPGYDMVGVVDALGQGTQGIAVGDRVADMPVHGGYSQYLIRPAHDLVPVPVGVDPIAAVDVPLMGVTAWQMLTRCVSLEAGAAILVVGASGAVGRMLVLLARHLGLRVVGTCSAGKRAIVADLGAIAIDHRRDDLHDAIREASGGAGVAAAFDAVGGVSWATSWSVLARGGTLVGYGMQDFLDSCAPSSKAVASLKRFHEAWPAEGAADGTGRRTLFYDINGRRQALPDDYRGDAQHLLALIVAGALTPPPAEVLPLDAAQAAHRRVAAGGLRHRLVLRP